MWDSGFLVRHAVVDAIYAAQLARSKGLPRLAVQPVLTLAFGFAHLLEARADEDLATHAITRELVASRAGELDAFLERHGAWTSDVDAALAGCIRALPASVRATVRADVAVRDFEQSAAVSDG